MHRFEEMFGGYCILSSIRQSYHVKTLRKKSFLRCMLWFFVVFFLILSGNLGLYICAKLFLIAVKGC